MSDPVNLLNLDRKSMESFFVSLGEKPFRATQMVKWIHQQGVTDFDAMTNLSKILRHDLPQQAQISLPRITLTQTSNDGTRKWLVQIDNKGNSVETVFIPEESRGTLCISSQVGCPLDCQFCSTAKQGFNRNLNTSEIISQLWIAMDQLDQFKNNRHQITNVVMMGMGEPLLNLDNVIPALRLMTDDQAYGLAKRRVTVSTAGVVPGIDKLATECDVALAVSLHAANDELRDRIVPLNRKYPLSGLLAACRRYAKIRGGDSITFEYVMLNGVNDSSADARQLARLLTGIPAKINLIPFNPFPGADFTRPEQSVIDQFRDILVRAGIVTTTRKTRGDDIAAACGQLAGKVMARGRRHRDKSKVTH
ncbi:MAG: 23S rRNA (adenine(2503)-C(2))-methyltransferase RlmN [Thiotrichales bacterium]|nr:23S rRNA (adenine(2503)-C(2))-methyltransferase RlmN [Thiotrichales bacterium]